MTRMAAREVIVHLVYALDFTKNLPELIQERTDPAFFDDLAGEDPLYDVPPDPENRAYIASVAQGTDGHLTELDSYIERYAAGWNFGRIPRVAVAIMRVCLYEILYRPDIPNAAAINAAVTLCKKYEEPEVAAFVNGILGSFIRGEGI